MAALNLEQKFDPASNRHYVNGEHFVLHCHHYATLLTQLAIDAEEMVGGTGLLRKSSEEALRPLLEKCMTGVSAPADRVALGCELYAAMGLGKMVAASAAASGGEVHLPHSHVDEGWIKKWGKKDVAINFIGAGFVAALFGAAFGKPAGAFKIEEIQSLVRGADKSVFKVSA